MSAARVGWVAMALAATVVAAVSARYWLADVTLVAPPLRQNFLDHTVMFVAHTVGGVIALAVGPWQFLGRLRSRRPAVHRWTGRVYLTAVAIGGVGALGIAPTTYAGPVAAWGFGVLAVCWLGTTGLALAAIKANDVPTHRRWMIRCYALTFAAVTLRLQLPLGAMLGVAEADMYRAVAWSSWVPNLIAVELYFAWKRGRPVAV